MPSGSRRRFLQGTLATAAALTLPRRLASAPSDPGEKSPDGTPEGFLIDVNVYVSHWPFRRMPGDEPGALLARPILQAKGMKE